jgi:iron complex outermembrane receptor protein
MKNYNYLKSIIILLFLIFPLIGFSQEISGIVKDANNSPLIGATVVIENTYIGTTTDANGKFIVNANKIDDGVLLVSFIGYKPQKLKIASLNDVSNVEVTLEEDLFGLSEIVVTSRRREEDIREVPLSVSTLSVKEIERTISTSTGDLLGVVPNVNVTGDQYSQSINIRGIMGGNGGNPGSGTAEGVYLNEVYQGPDEFQNNFVVDLARIEVLRGPQGTQFGKNAIAGAVNMTTIKPTPKNYATLNLDYGDRNFMRIRPVVNAKLTKSINVRASVLHYRYDGYIKNIADGKNSDSEVTAGRIDLNFRPNENFVANLGFDFTDENYVEQQPNVVSWANAPFTEIPLDVAFNAGYGINLNDDGRGTFNHNVSPFYKKKLWGTSLNMGYYIGKSAVIKSITSYRDATREWKRDLDFSIADAIYEDREDRGKQFSQELKISSSSSNKLNWVGGLFYYNMNSDFSQNITLGSFMDVLYGTPAGTLEGSSIFPRAEITQNNLGIYASADYRFLDFFTINAGIRYTIDKKEISFQQDGVPAVGYQAFPDANLDGVADEGEYLKADHSENIITPTVSLKAKPFEWANAYISYARGYKSGGFNVRFISSAQELETPFDAEIMDNYEVGVKLSNANNTFFANLAAFLMNYDNLQVPVTTEDGTGIAINNAAKAQVKGFEADITYLITKNIAFSGGFGYNQSEYTDYVAELPDGSTIDRAGERLNNIPDMNANAAIDLNFPIGKVKLVGRIQYKYRGELDQPTYIDATDANTIDALGLWSSRIGVEGKKWGAYLWGRNLADKEYIIGKGTTGISPFIRTFEQIGEPRLIGVNMVYTFGNK